MLFGGQYNKALVALVMAILLVLEDWWGITFPGITEQGVITILSLLTPLFVWLVPNR